MKNVFLITALSISMFAKSYAVIPVTGAMNPSMFNEKIRWINEQYQKAQKDLSILKSTDSRTQDKTIQKKVGHKEVR